MRPVTQQLIKNSNMKRLYASVYNHPGISRAALAKRTRLSKTTVSTLIDELIEREFLIDSGVSETESVGRRPNTLYVRSGRYYVTVLHWMEDTVQLYLIDLAGVSVCQFSEKVTGTDTYLTVSRKCFYDSLLTRYDSRQILGICVVVSAMIDAAREEIYSTTLSLPALGEEKIFPLLPAAFPEYPVAFLEDTACFAYAEKVYTSLKENNFAFINFNRGIGATLFIEGNMLGKASGSFTQFGHYSVDPEGPLCVCGNHGCLEALISEHNIGRRAAAFGESPFLTPPDRVTFADLGRAALYRDPTTMKLLAQMARELALALGNLICIVNPSLIILGGKIPALGDYFLEQVRKDLKSIGFRKMVDNVTVRYSTLHSDSFLSGAMRYYFDIHYSFTQENPSGFYVG